MFALIHMNIIYTYTHIYGQSRVVRQYIVDVINTIHYPDIVLGNRMCFWTT